MERYICICKAKLLIYINQLLIPNFSREEIKSGLRDITARYGVEDFAEMFLQ